MTVSEMVDNQTPESHTEDGRWSTTARWNHSPLHRRNVKRLLLHDLRIHQIVHDGVLERCSIVHTRSIDWSKWCCRRWFCSVVTAIIDCSAAIVATRTDMFFGIISAFFAMRGCGMRCTGSAFGERMLVRNDISIMRWIGEETVQRASGEETNVANKRVTKKERQG